MSSFDPEEREAIRLVFDSILEEMRAKRAAAEGKPAPPPKSEDEQRRLDAAKEFLREHARNEPKTEEERQRRIDERLAELGYTRASLDEAKSAANRRNYRNGRYHNDRRQPAGSPDNPIPVGMEGCSHTLFFDLESGLWKLTDGLGNGYIR